MCVVSMSSTTDTLSQHSSPCAGDKNARVEDIGKFDSRSDLMLHGHAAMSTNLKPTAKRAHLAQHSTNNQESGALGAYYHPSWHQERSLARCARINNFKGHAMQKQYTAPDLGISKTKNNSGGGGGSSKEAAAASNHDVVKDTLIRRNTTVSAGNTTTTSKPGKITVVPVPTATSEIDNQNGKNHEHHLELDYKGTHILLESGSWDSIRQKNQLAPPEFVRIVGPKPLHVSPRDGSTSRTFKDSFAFLEKYYKTQGDKGSKDTCDEAQPWKISVHTTKSTRGVQDGGERNDEPWYYDDPSGKQKAGDKASEFLTANGLHKNDYSPALSPISEAHRSSRIEESHPGSPQHKSMRHRSKTMEIETGKPWWRHEAMKME